MSVNNHVIITGNVGRDPITFKDGKVARFRFATNERIYNSTTGEVTKRTDWHSAVAFGHNAELVAKYVKSGYEVKILGELRTGKKNHPKLKEKIDDHYVRISQIQWQKPMSQRLEEMEDRFFEDTGDNEDWDEDEDDTQYEHDYEAS